MATTLPFHILVLIVAAARDLDPVSWDHGGKTGWDSNESIASLALVSSAWSEATNFCLYRSVAILGDRTADLFLRTIRKRPARAALVRSLVIGLDEDAEEPMAEEEGGDPREVSAKLVEIVEACSNVDTLQIRPLDPSARPRLLAAITSKALTALVCSPRRDTTVSTLFHPHDIITLATPTLKYLELEFSSTSTPSSAPSPSPLPILPALSLSELHIVCCGEGDAIFHLLSSAGPTLEVVDLYFEAVIAPERATTALLPSTRTLRRLTYITNPSNEDLQLLPSPTTPILDFLLPHFLRLSHLSTSATDLSSSQNLWRRFPPSLRHFEVQSFNHSPAFVHTEEMVKDLEDKEVPVELKTFGLRDGAWTPGQVRAVDKACAARGVSFEFYPD